MAGKSRKKCGICGVGAEAGPLRQDHVQQGHTVYLHEGCVGAAVFKLTKSAYFLEKLKAKLPPVPANPFAKGAP